MREALFPGSAAELRAWFIANHRELAFVWIGFHKKGTDEPTVTYHEALDEALSFGWIDGVRQGVDAGRYRIRFTPRKARSIWSKVNIARAHDLEKAGRMHASGREAFARRDETRTGYSYESKKDHRLRPADVRAFKKNARAWEFFAEQPPYYRKVASFWVTSAKKEETRQRRLRELIAISGRSQRLPQLTGKTKGKT